MAISLFPDFTRAWNSKGFAYYEKGEYDEAKHCWRKSLSINPNQSIVKDKLDELN